MPARRWASAAVVAAGGLATLVVGGCGNGEDRPAQVSGSASGTGTGSVSGTGGGEHAHHQERQATFGRSEANTVVVATMRDYAYGGIPPFVKGPKVLFEVVNEGPAQHEFLLVDAAGKEVTALEPYPKGATRTLAAELPPGSYTVRCLVEEGAKTHAQLGMEASFTVQ